MEKFRKFLIVFAAVVNLLLVDAVTKELAAHYLKNSSPISVVEGFFDLAYVENRGCAWGMLQGQVWPLAIFGILALFFLIWQRKYVFQKVPGSKVLSFAVSSSEVFLYTGIIGNLIDRIYRGYVIDFVDLHYYETYHFPCFNFADMFICLAAFILILASFKNGKPSKAA
jgi:signal peptidase II